MSFGNIQETVHHHRFGQPLVCHRFADLLRYFLEGYLPCFLWSQRDGAAAIAQDLCGMLPVQECVIMARKSSVT
jgi:hypothetical protein